MTTTDQSAEPIDITVTAPLRQDDPGAWTIVVVPHSGEILGTRKAVKVGGEADGHPFRATLLPMGDGTHMVPVKAALRQTLGKSAGDEVTMRLTERFS